MARKKPATPSHEGRREARDRIQTLQEVLMERRRIAQREMDALSRSLREERGSETWDEGDRAVQELDRDLGSTRLNRLTQQLDQVEKALARHAEGRYGRCAACGADIPLARLRSLPFALNCRNCQEVAEGAVGQAAQQRGEDQMTMQTAWREGGMET